MSGIVVCADKRTTVFSNCTDGEIRLVGGANVTLGILQVCMNNAWGSVCNNRFGIKDVNVVCRELGFNATGGKRFINSAGSMFNISSGPIFLDRVTCNDNKRLIDCPLSGGTSFGQSECDHTQLAGVQCVGM